MDLALKRIFRLVTFLSAPSECIVDFLQQRYDGIRKQSSPAEDAEGNQDKYEINIHAITSQNRL